MLKKAKMQWGLTRQALQAARRILEAQEAPKSMPKPQKIDVENQHDFGIVFFIVPTSFWKGFWCWF